jgi:hypothetical protein
MAVQIPSGHFSVVNSYRLCLYQNLSLISLFTTQKHAISQNKLI